MTLFCVLMARAEEAESTHSRAAVGVLGLWIPALGKGELGPEYPFSLDSDEGASEPSKLSH